VRSAFGALRAFNTAEQFVNDGWRQMNANQKANHIDDFSTDCSLEIFPECCNGLRKKVRAEDHAPGGSFAIFLKH
jgi:hypothetical protein